MQKINGYWVDDNNNKWDCVYCSEEKAQELSKTLINCSNCRDCSYCSNCSNCSYCSNFETQPQIYTTLYIGSRQSITIFYRYEDTIYVACGCFWGNLGEFEAKVLETYPKGKYHDEYMKEIEKVKVLFN